MNFAVAQSRRQRMATVEARTVFSNAMRGVVLREVRLWQFPHPLLSREPKGRCN